MSGTSGDGIDIAIVEFDPTPTIIAARTQLFPAALHEQLVAALNAPDALTLPELGALDRALGAAYARAVSEILEAHPEAPVSAIACHGQTLYHAPDATPGWTWQAGNPTILTEQTGLPVIYDFRRADLSAGGQGAPLAPLFHREVLAQPGENLAVVNLGGIANLTVVNRHGETIGFDTGPANVLMDEWSRREFGVAFDANGDIAEQGAVSESLLSVLLADPYFEAPYPKSTGRETFGSDWLDRRLKAWENQQMSQQTVRREDIMATLCELTAVTVSESVERTETPIQTLLVCGGGARNQSLMQRIERRLNGVHVESTATRGIDPDFVEAGLIAWLGWQRWQGKPIDTRSVTGARHKIMAGSICLPPPGERNERDRANDAPDQRG